MSINSESQSITTSLRDRAKYKELSTSFKYIQKWAQAMNFKP
jgi:hypothetical protein